MLRNILVIAFLAATAAPGIGQGASDVENQFAALQPQFEAAWAANACAKGESRASYIGWIHGFYIDGGGGSQGWFAQSASILGRVPESQRQAISLQLQDLGSKIAQEWAKPNDCRKISTFGASDSLSAYGSLLDPYVKSSGVVDAGALSATLKQIEDSVRKAIGG